MMSNRIFANTGKRYAVGNILDAEKKLDHAKYEAYSKPYMAASNLGTSEKRMLRRRTRADLSLSFPSPLRMLLRHLHRYYHPHHSLPQEGDRERFQGGLQVLEGWGEGVSSRAKTRRTRRHRLTFFLSLSLPSA